MGSAFKVFENINCSLLAGGLWVFLSLEYPENAEFAIAAPSWTCTQIGLGRNGAGDRELRVFRGFPAIKIPTNHLQAGYINCCI